MSKPSEHPSERAMKSPIAAIDQPKALDAMAVNEEEEAPRPRLTQRESNEDLTPAASASALGLQPGDPRATVYYRSSIRPPDKNCPYMEGVKTK